MIEKWNSRIGLSTWRSGAGLGSPQQPVRLDEEQRAGDDGGAEVDPAHRVTGTSASDVATIAHE